MDSNTKLIGRRVSYLIEETIEVDLSDDPNNPKIIQLGKSLNKDEICIYNSKKNKIYSHGHILICLD